MSEYFDKENVKTFACVMFVLFIVTAGIISVKYNHDSSYNTGRMVTNMRKMLKSEGGSLLYPILQDTLRFLNETDTIE